jgi:FkbM family methyltransferase
MLIKEDNHREDIALLLESLPASFKKTGVIHVGAHMGEEVEFYLRVGFKKIVLIEAHPDCCRKMKEKFKDNPEVSIHNFAIADAKGKIELHLHTSRSGDTEPASILQMKKLKEIVHTLNTKSTIEVDSITLDEFVADAGFSFDEISFMNIDIQGAELIALAGAKRLLKSLGAIICEVALIELYHGGAMEKDIDELLENSGFKKTKAIYHTLYDKNSTFPAWGECLFVRE